MIVMMRVREKVVKVENRHCSWVQDRKWWLWWEWGEAVERYNSGTGNDDNKSVNGEVE